MPRIAKPAFTISGINFRPRPQKRSVWSDMVNPQQVQSDAPPRGSKGQVRWVASNLSGTSISRTNKEGRNRQCGSRNEAIGTQKLGCQRGIPPVGAKVNPSFPRG
jgi:hypothetical protein